MQSMPKPAKKFGLMTLKCRAIGPEKHAAMSSIAVSRFMTARFMSPVWTAI